MLDLHIPTLLFSAAIVNITLTFFCLNSWLGRRDRQIYKWLALTGGAATLGFLALLVHGRELPIVCVWTAQACFQAAAATTWSGIRVFEGRKPLRLVMCAGPLVWIAAYFIPGVVENFTIRATLSSIIIAIYYVAMMIELGGDIDSSHFEAAAWPSAFWWCMCFSFWDVSFLP